MLVSMKRLPFRDFHIVQILKAFRGEHCPLDLFIHRYFREHKSLGSSDRASITENIYDTVRQWGLEANYIEVKDLKNNTQETLPPALFNLLHRHFGEAGALSIAEELNRRAPTTIRANLLKITRDQLLEKFATRFPVRPCLYSPTGIIFEEKTNFLALTEFTEGLFEIQDEASQLIAHQLGVQPGDHILDYCSGSGGKSLALAHYLQGKGQLYLHDVRKKILIQAKKRLARAGIQNSQLIHNEELKRLNALKGRMDFVLADVPCTGTGTMRRNPDMKWRFTEEGLSRVLELQRQIFTEALLFLKPRGQIIYATCSLLPDENQMQTEYFLKKLPLKQVKEPFCSLPSKGGMDGFYAVVFERTNC